MRFSPRLLPLVTAAVALLSGGCSVFRGGSSENDADDVQEMQPHARRGDLPSLLAPGNGRVSKEKFPVIRFQGESWELSAPEKAKVRQVARWFAGHPERVLISAGADTAPPEYARQLSDLRAQTVRAALISAGVLESKILTVGFGDDAPSVTGNGVTFSALNTGEAP